MNHLRLRNDVIRLIKTNKLIWADKLPEQLLDTEAIEFLKDIKNNPAKLVTTVDIFALDERVAEFKALLDLVLRLRTDALATEAELYEAVLSDDLERKQAPQIRSLAALSARANWAVSPKPNGPDPTGAVTALYDELDTAREQRQSFRGIPGHPLNLTEQVVFLRERYIQELQLLLARATGLRLVLKTSYGVSIPSLLDQVAALKDDEPNPLPTIFRWFRDAVLRLQKAMLDHRVVTLYRLLGEDKLIDERDDKPIDREKLKGPIEANDVVTIKLALNNANLGLTGKQKARVLAIGLAPVIPQSTSAEILTDMTDTHVARFELVERRRALYRQERSTQSYVFELATPDKIFIQTDGGDNRPYKVLGLKEQWTGVGAWALGGGSLEQAIPLREVSRLTNRPAGDFIELTLRPEVRDTTGVRSFVSDYWKKETDSGIPFLEKVPQDIAIAIRVAIYEDEVTE
jgi:hypothetical protein